MTGEWCPIISWIIEVDSGLEWNPHMIFSYDIRLSRSRTRIHACSYDMQGKESDSMNIIW